jgi:hypothetical protein
MAHISRSVQVALLSVTAIYADQKKLTEDQRVEIMRGLTAEYAKCRVQLPKSSKPLDIRSDGSFDKSQWDDAYRAAGPAARVGDEVKITKVSIERDSILLEINGGARAARGSWRDHVQIGVGGMPTATTTQSGGPATNAPAGTNLALRFGGPIGEITSAEIKKMLAPVLEFDKETVTEQYVDTLPPEIKAAVQNKKAIEGMDRDQVILALGKPVRKSRESKDGVDYEDWIYGTPPGRITFVTFSANKVVKVKETYAGLGGTVAETPKPQ